MFINHPATILFVSISILAICTGVFGYMSLFGVTLDPIVMSISIMCVGFSVDIPAHVSFHFHASRTHVMNDQLAHHSNKCEKFLSPGDDAT
ncbi:hypothetical protein COOONC_03628 [Cooperia oncophora]